MAYVGRVRVPTEWTSLESLLDTSFDSSKEYSIQAGANSNVRLCNSTSLPQDEFDGENIKDLMQAIYKPDAGTLYVRTAVSAPSFVVVSELG